MTRATERFTQPGGVLALIRLAAVPVFYAAERLVEHPVANTRPFGVLLAVAGVYAISAFVAETRGRPLAPAYALAFIDLTLITALVATSGGPFSQLRFAFFVLPVCAGLLLRPALTAAASVLCLVLYIGVALTYPDVERVRSDALEFETLHLIFMAWMGAAATVLSAVLTRRSREITELAESRGRLVADALSAEDRARRRLAEALHDEALQNLLAARQLLDADDPESAALAREGIDEGVAQIRRAVFDLHPYLLEQAGLGAAVEAVAARAGERGGFAATVDIDRAAAGLHDQLLFAIARELLANCAKHAQASNVAVTIRRLEDAVELTVVDDGRGIDLARARQAPLRGHIGLASCAERAEAIGGEFEITPRPDAGGTRVRLSLAAPVRGESEPARR